MTFHLRDLIRWFKAFGTPTNGQVLKYNSTTARPEWGDAASGGPTDADVLAVDYTVTAAGEKVLEVTAPTEGVYLLESMLQGLSELGTADAFDGVPVCYMISDMVEGPLGSANVFLKTINAVDGIRLYKRSDTPSYLTGNDVPFWDADGRYAFSHGTGLAFYQRQMIYLEANGKVEFFIKNDNTNGEAVGGFQKLLAGSKIQITKMADFTL